MPPLFLAGGPARFLPRKRLMQVSVLCQRRRPLSLSSRPNVPWPGTSLNHIVMMMPHTLPQVGLAGRLLGGCASVPPPSHYGWAHRSPPLHHRTPCPTGSDRSTRTHGHTPGCTTATTLFLVGGPTGRLLHMSIPHARRVTGGGPAGRPRRMAGPHATSALPPTGGPAGRLMPVAVPQCRHPFSSAGPQAASCPWLYRYVTTLSCRWARRPPHARGCTHATTLSRR